MEEVKSVETLVTEEKHFRWKSSPVNMFNRGVLFFIGPQEELIKTLAENFDEYAETIQKTIKEDGIEPDNYALGYTFKVLPDALVWCPEEPTVKVAVHELTHCVYHILKQVEIPLTDDTEEVFAYMMEYLYAEFIPWVERKEN